MLVSQTASKYAKYQKPVKREARAAMDFEKQGIDAEVKASDASFDSDRERRASVAKITKVSSILMVLVSGLALFSDGQSPHLAASPTCVY
jgi:hypothetical protein